MLGVSQYYMKMTQQENQEKVTVQVHQVLSSLDPIQEFVHQVHEG